MDISTKKGIIDYCKKFINPVIITDNNFNVVYCNRSSFIKIGTCLSDYAHTGFEVSSEKQTLAMVVLKGIQYCARIMPLTDELIMCEIFDIESIRQLSQYLNILDKVMPLVEGINTYSMQGINLVFHLFQNDKIADNPEMYNALMGIYRCGNNLRSISDNLRIYTKMLYERKLSEFIDIYALVDGIIKRCNIMLSKCGRRIYFIGDDDGIFISADQRYVICTFMNALQNAVLYSPKDTVPTVALYKIDNCGKPMACLKVVNDDIYFSEDSLLDDANFSSQRIGFGIPIIRRFAELYGGEFSMEKLDGKVILMVKIPAYTGDDKPVSDEINYPEFNSGVPDMVDEKMKEVLAFYGVDDIKE